MTAPLDRWVDSPHMVLGVDPGCSGALVLMGRGVLRVWRGFNRAKDGGYLDVSKAANEALSHKPDSVMLEFVHAFPDQGVSSVWTFGKATGVVLGAIYSNDMEPKEVPPQVWQTWVKRLWGSPIPPKCFDSRIMAARWFGEKNLPYFSNRRSLDHNATDAAMIAAYGLDQATRSISAQAPELVCPEPIRALPGKVSELPPELREGF